MDDNLGPFVRPSHVTLEGAYCRLEPLDEKHLKGLYSAIDGEEKEARHRWLPDTAPDDFQSLVQWHAKVSKDPDFVYFAVIDRQNGKCGGRHALMRIRPEHGSVEIGSVIWGQGIARTRIATEALYLTAHHVFEDLGYRRFEWKCNARNTPSRAAATRFGFTFEGIFRQDMVVKGENRDTAWFSMLDHEWLTLKEKYEAFLHPDNFDAAGIAKSRLDTPRL